MTKEQKKKKSVLKSARLMCFCCLYGVFTFLKKQPFNRDSFHLEQSLCVALHGLNTVGVFFFFCLGVHFPVWLRWTHFRFFVLLVRIFTKLNTWGSKNTTHVGYASYVRISRVSQGLWNTMFTFCFDCWLKCR